MTTHEKRFSKQKFSELINITPATLTKWNKTGKLKNKKNRPNSRPYYTLEDYLRYKKFIDSDEMITVKKRESDDPLDEPLLTFTWTKKDVIKILKKYGIPITDENIQECVKAFTFGKYAPQIQEAWDGFIQMHTATHCLKHG